jgi:putative glutamine amidotransferase
VTVAVTDPERDPFAFERYAGWLRRWIPEANVRHLSYKSDDSLDGCRGLLLTGGGDVHPKYYGRLDALDLMRDVDEQRDEYEFRLIDEAMKFRIPVLGVCRGAQVFTVARGGTLVPDIECSGHPSHAKVGKTDRVHGVKIEPGSLLAGVATTEIGTVNSSHHQAVEAPGGDLRVSARSDDGVVEALEWREPANRPFLLLVQWHPERMAEVDSPFAKNIILRFAREIERAAR